MFGQDEIKNRFPLHYLIWNDDHEELKRYLKQHSKVNLELKDRRSRTPLMLAVTLGHKKCAQILLSHNASVSVTDSSGFNVLHESIPSTDPEFIRDVYEKKEMQLYSSRVAGIPNLLTKIRDTTDFYLEMKWEFTSWVPFISRLCPNDTYKIYKSGSKVRVDTTLAGMDSATNWQRGKKSFIFNGSENGAVFIQVDHETKQITKKTMQVITQEEIREFLQPTEEQIADRLSNPICTTFIDTEKIHFERAKSGIIGFRSDRVENINGYECKVFCANNVELATKTRTEHLTQDDKDRLKSMESGSKLSSIQSFAGISETVHPNPFKNVPIEDQWRHNPYKLTLVDYFNLEPNSSVDIGVPRELTVKSKHFNATLWFSEEFPLSLTEQILPIVNLMAINSSHFAKLRDFITLRLPAGFPVKIEIPVFHLLTAQITFGNIFATNDPVDGVKTVNIGTVHESSSSIDPRSCRCTVDESCFIPPEDYEVIGSDFDDLPDSLNGFGDQAQATDDQYMQLALEQYFKQEGVNGNDQMTFLEALNTNQPDVDSDLQRAIQLSLLEYQREQLETNGDIIEKSDNISKTIKDSNHSSTIDDDDDNNDSDCTSEKPLSGTETDSKFDENKIHQNGVKKSIISTETGDDDPMFQTLLEQSKKDHEQELHRRQTEEEEVLQKVLQISLIDK